MKIGVVTFWGTKDNYGQVLQCYALQKVLNKLGHKALLIKYDILDYERERVAARRSLISHVKDILRRTLFKIENILHDRRFKEFYKKYIMSVGPYSIVEIRKKTLDFDVLIAGSDQIWSMDCPFLFLDFGKGIKKIAYAVSFGGSEFPKDFLERVRPWVNEFSHISVREETGISICKQLKRDDAVCFPDPTLLLTSEEYDDLIPYNDSIEYQDYILVYWLSNPAAISVREIRAFAKRKKLNIVYVTGQGKLDFCKKSYPTIPEWLALIKNATYVITNSFHGCVFSIMMKKNFLVIPLIGKYARMNGRIDMLLNKYNLKSRKWTSSLDAIFAAIDYTDVHMKLEKERQEVISQLSQWIKE